MNELHLLYVNGDADYVSLQRILEQYDHCSIGPQCWILRGLPRERRRLSERLQRILPEAPERGELLLCPLSSDQILHTTEGGLGLRAWLKK